MPGIYITLSVSAAITFAMLVFEIAQLKRKNAKLETLAAEADEIISRWSGWASHCTALKSKSENWLRRRRESLYD